MGHGRPDDRIVILTQTRPRDYAVPVLLGAGATGIGLLVPVAGPLLIALLAGAVVANLVEIPSGWSATTKTALRLGVVLLGLKLPVNQVLDIGWQGIATVLITIAATYGGTLLVGRRLRTDDDITRLIAVGFSICGAAAIAAVEDAVHARREAVALAVAMVTLWGSLMIAVVPALSSWFGLSDRAAGVWVGASVHEVAQVVATASVVGGGAVAVATTIKLMRVVMLAPMHVVVARGSAQHEHQATPGIPWFVTAFVLAIAVRSTGVLGSGALDVANAASLFLLAMGMVGLGFGVRLATLWPLPWRVVALAACSTVIALTVSGALVVLLLA